MPELVARAHHRGHHGGVAAPSHYQLLGVTPQATTQEIRRAYHRRARRQHPDAHPDADAVTAEAARRAMADLNAAWAVLSDPVKRRAYDAELGLDPPRPSTPPWTDVTTDREHRFDVDLDEFGPEPEPRPSTVGDMVVLVPVAILALSAAMFAFGVMTGSATLWAASLLMLPVAGVGFVATQLVVMRRGSVRREQ